MIIKEMTASFGRLDRAHLKLSEGLNIIHAPNEGGKSTWCAFIRAMLYGVPSRERDKKGFLAEKNRYLPWSGTPMEGEMTLEWQGRDITLRRFTKGATPFGGFSAVYTDTQLPVPDLTAQNCGEVLLGVGREVWERSAFIGSSPTLAIDGTPELERRIAALFSSGEEDVSFSQTEARLREWQRRRQHNRSGLIPKLETELAELDRTLDRMQAANLRLSQSQQERAALEEQQRTLEAELYIHQRLARRELNGRYAQAVQEQERIRAQQDELLAQQSKFGPLPHRDRLRDAQLQLQRLTLQEEELSQQDSTANSEPLTPPADPRFEGLDGTQAARRAQEERSQAETLLAQAREKEGQRRRHVQSGFGFFAGAVIAGIASGYPLVGLLAGAALAILLVLTLLGPQQGRNHPSTNAGAGNSGSLGCHHPPANHRCRRVVSSTVGLFCPSAGGAHPGPDPAGGPPGGPNPDHGGPCILCAHLCPRGPFPVRLFRRSFRCVGVGGQTAGMSVSALPGFSPLR